MELDYSSLLDNALRAIVRDVLLITQELGVVPGDHHFYIEFQTDAPGVDIPDRLKASYPDRMTIVLQHQFKDLIVEDEKFSVTLWFKGEPSVLVVPFDAVTTFADPSVQFELQYAQSDRPGSASIPFQNGKSVAPTSLATPMRAESGGRSSNQANGVDEIDDQTSGEVVSLDAFRKK